MHLTVLSTFWKRFCFQTEAKDFPGRKDAETKTSMEGKDSKTKSFHRRESLRNEKLP